jgi:hypothetical protein
MKSEKMTFIQIENAIFEAIFHDDKKKLEFFINSFLEEFLTITAQNEILIDCFKSQSVNCFKYIVENVAYPSKVKELNRLQSYLSEAISSTSTQLVSMEISVDDFTDKHLVMIELLGSESAKSVVGKLLLAGLDPTITTFAFNVFLQAQNISPMDYLSDAQTSIEKELCLKLMAAGV